MFYSGITADMTNNKFTFLAEQNLKLMCYNNAKITCKSYQKNIFELSKIVVSMLNNLKYKGLQRYDQKTAANTLLLSSQLSHSKLHQLISQQKIINFEKCDDENKNDKLQEYFFNCAGFDNAKMYIYERSDDSCFM